MIEADPALTAVATPLAFTVATPVAVDDHVIARPVRIPPAESRVVALNVADCATRMVADGGVTVTVATGTSVTVTRAVSALPSLLAMIEANPTATPATPPLASTLAIDDAVETHVIARPVNTAPVESRVVAVNEALPPTRRVADAGASVRLATGMVVTSTTAVSLTPDVSDTMTVSRPGPLPAR